MARVAVDFSEVPDFTPVPADEYPVVIEKVTYVENQNEGKSDYMAWELMITEGEYANRKLWLNTSFSPKALFKLKEILENLGLYEDELEIDFEEDADNLVTTPELSGLPAIAVVSLGSYQGKPTNNVDTLIASDTAPAGTKTTASPPKKAAGKKFQ